MPPSNVQVQTTLQDRYPLSPRKFWKKTLTNFIGIGCLYAFLIVSFIGAIAVLDGNDKDSSVFWMLASMVTIFFALWIFLYAWYIKVYIRRYYYDAGENFVTIKKGVFAPTEIHVQYTKIQDVYVDQDILDRMMGLYDVHLASATVASGIEAHIDGVDGASAEAIKELLLAKITGKASGQGGGSSPTSAPAAPFPQKKMELTEEISSKIYPLENRWLFLDILQYSLTYVVVAAFLVGKYYASGANSDGFLAASGMQELFVLIGIYIVLIIIHIIYDIIWRSNFYFTFTPDFIALRQGVVSKSEQHIPYNSIQDVTVKQGILERICGLATVQIANAAQGTVVVGRTQAKGGIIIPGQSITSANHIADSVRSILLQTNPTTTGL